jgi:RNA polymerase sigma-70 factor (ECF subfamily)
MDEELIRRACAGDGEAIGRLYERHATRVYAIVRRLSGDDTQAEDWAQDAWLRVFRGLHGFRGEAQFTTWLHRIAVNAALQGQRAQRQRGLHFEEVDTVPERAAVTAPPLLRLSLAEAIDRLPPGMRNVLVLHDVEGYTHEEMGEMLGVSAGTCKSQLFKARAKVREMLEPAVRERDGEREGEKICTT